MRRGAISLTVSSTNVGIVGTCPGRTCRARADVRRFTPPMGREWRSEGVRFALAEVRREPCHDSFPTDRTGPRTLGDLPTKGPLMRTRELGSPPTWENSPPSGGTPGAGSGTPGPGWTRRSRHGRTPGALPVARAQGPGASALTSRAGEPLNRYPYGGGSGPLVVSRRNAPSC